MKGADSFRFEDVLFSSTVLVVANMRAKKFDTSELGIISINSETY